MGGMPKLSSRPPNPFNFKAMSNTWLGFYKPFRKLVDPLNIMDPFSILPGSWAEGRKPFSLDPNYGGPIKNLLSPKQYSPLPASKIDMSGGFAQNAEMLSALKAQNEADIARRQASNARLASSGPMYASATSAPVSQATTTNPTVATPSTTPIAQSKVDGITTPLSDLPVDLVYKPAQTSQSNVAANTFNLPDMSSIKFGGT